MALLSGALPASLRCYSLSPRQIAADPGLVANRAVGSIRVARGVTVADRDHVRGRDHAGDRQRRRGDHGCFASQPQAVWIEIKTDAPNIVTVGIEQRIPPVGSANIGSVFRFSVRLAFI